LNVLIHVEISYKPDDSDGADSRGFKWRWPIAYFY
jgi:hypothetical protein